MFYSNERRVLSVTFDIYCLQVTMFVAGRAHLDLRQHQRSTEEITGFSLATISVTSQITVWQNTQFSSNLLYVEL